MKTWHLLMCAFFLLFGVGRSAAAPAYQDDEEFKVLRANMTRAFNEGDSAAFFPALKALEDYLYDKNDLHAYYTQRCNEIIFQMNRQNIFEAYKLAQQLSHELVERKLDKEMYMAVNMMGHISRYCGNEERALQCFEEVIRRMEQAGYTESMPPIYLNIVNVIMDDNPEEAMQLLDKALAIARESSPERVFDIEARRTMLYYSLKDTANFLKGYDAYWEGVNQGKNSVSGRSLEIYYQALTGHTDEALAMAQELLGDDGYDTQTELLKDAGRWQEAFEMQTKQREKQDSLNSVILSNSMAGIENELRINEAEQRASRNKLLALGAATMFLLLLIVALAYIVWSRRRHIRQLRSAYEHALESDRMKTAFMRNVSHEVRTPLNIISGFAQVIADPNLDYSPEERRRMALMMRKNTNAITSLVDEMLELSHSESVGGVEKADNVKVNVLLRELVEEARENVADEVVVSLDSSLADDFIFKTNRQMMRRVVDVLLSNALKFTEKGSVVVSASLVGEQQLLLAVTDTGCGIPASEAEHIFERFVKLDSFKVGIGLGLTLCRASVEKLGGSISLDTSYTGGARFVVTLPRQAE